MKLHWLVSCLIVTSAMASCGGGEGPGGVGEDDIVFGTRVHPMPKRNRIVTTPPVEPSFAYYGGPVLGQARVVEVLWGPDVALAADIGRFYADITQSEYFDVLSEYRTPDKAITHGTFVGLVTDPSPPSGAVVDDKAIQTELARLLHNKVLPENDDDTVYMVHFPPGMTIKQGGAASCTNFCAYHGTFKRNGKMVPYAVLPDLDGGCAQGCGDGNKLANSTWVASHVLAQTVTNPAVGFSGNGIAAPLAWFDPMIGEISDACLGKAEVAGFVVKTQWSLTDGRCRFGTGEGAAFSVAVSPGEQMVRAGTSATLLVKTTATAPQAPSVTLSVSGVPAGVTASFEPGVVTAGDEAVLTLLAAGSAGATVTELTVKGTAGSTTQTAKVTLTVESAKPANDFTLEITPVTRAVGRGEAVTFSLQTAVASGVAETVTPSVTGLPDGVTAVFAPPSITAGGTSELTVSAGATAQLGSALLTVTAMSPTKTRTATLSLDVEDVPPTNDFAVGISPTSRTVAAGAQVSFNVTTTLTSGSPQLVALAASGLPPGVTASFVPAQVTSGAAATLTLTASVNTAAASGPFTVTGTAPSGARTTTASLTVTPAPPTNDFSVTVSPPTRSVAAGEATTFTVGTTVTSGSAVPVAFAISGLPSGVTAIFAPSSVSSGQSATLTINAAFGAAQGTSSLTITGASTAGNHTASAGLTVLPPPASDFSIGLTPSGQTVAAGSSTSFVVSTHVLSGSAETVTLSTTGLPAGVSATFTPPSVTAGGSSTLTLSADEGAAAVSNDAFTVRGIAPSMTRSVGGTISVTALPPPNDFSLGVSPPSAEVMVGASTTFMVTTAATSGSAQQVALAASGLPSTVTGVFNPPTVTAGGTSLLTISAGAAATPGPMTFTVSGTAPSGTKVASVDLEILPAAVGNLIVNGDFETGSLSGWTIDEGSYVVEVSTATRHGGMYSGRVGETLSGPAFGPSALYQRISLPAGRTTTLTYWSYPRCPDGLGVQQGYIMRPDFSVLRKFFDDCDNSATWAQHSLDLTPWAGSDVLLYFYTDDGFFDPTWIYLDDVRTATQ